VCFFVAPLRTGQLILRMTNGDAGAAADPYMQPIRLADKAGTPELSHIIPGKMWWGCTSSI
jgi:hypothetical protein